MAKLYSIWKYVLKEDHRHGMCRSDDLAAKGIRRAAAKKEGKIKPAHDSWKGKKNVQVAKDAMFHTWRRYGRFRVWLSK